MRYLLIVFILLLLNPIILQGKWIDVFKKGVIKIQANHDYGKNVQWDDLLFVENQNIICAPDGSVFLTASNHKIHKFSSRGDLVKTFGGKGEGPGDLYYPSRLSILDGKYLIVGEYAARRRISIFDFSGKCVNVVKVKQGCFSPIGLKNNHIAYISINCVPGKNKNTEYNCIHTVIIKTIDSKHEQSLDSYKLINKKIVLKSGMPLKVSDFMGRVYITNTGNGNLLVGVSNSKEIKIFSNEGEFLRTFKLKIPSTPVPLQYVKDYKNKVLESIKERPLNQKMYEMIDKAIRATDFKTHFGEFLPYFHQILVDSDGNILVFRFPDSTGKRDEIFQVYAPDGTFICETRIDDGIYDFQIDPIIRGIQFTDKGILGLFKLENDEDALFRLINVKPW